MQDTRDEILDYKPKKFNHGKLIVALYILAISFFIYWLVPNSYQLPFKKIALVAGLFSLIFISILQFNSKANKTSGAVFSFIGRLALIVGIYPVFTGHRYAAVFVITAGVLFLLGIFKS